MKFTKASVEKLLAAPPATEFVWDASCPGFGIRFRGAPAWYVQLRVNGNTRRAKLGDVARIELDAARTAAKQFNAQATLGSDPIKAKAEARAKAATTVGPTVELYLTACESSLRPSSLRHVRRSLLKYFVGLHKLPLASVTRADVATAVTKIAQERGKIAAKRARAHLSSFFAWCIGAGITNENPVIGTNSPAPKEKPRDRTLKPTEIKSIWNALPDNDFGNVMRLLFWTACRRSEIGSLLWSEVDLDEGQLTIQASRMKGGREHKLPLVPAAVELLRSVTPRPGNPHVFGSAQSGLTGWSKPVKQLQDALAAAGDVTAPWRLHDVRRTIRSQLEDKCDVNPWVSEMILAHVKSGVEAHYNFAKLERQMRQALGLWADRLDSIVTGTESNVVQLRA